MYIFIFDEVHSDKGLFLEEKGVKDKSGEDRTLGNEEEREEHKGNMRIKTNSCILKRNMCRNFNNLVQNDNKLYDVKYLQ